VTERIIVAGKGRFDRALTPKKRAARQLPSVTTISRDEFLDATTDLWEFAPESAKRVNHPAPFPVELPRRLIDLFTYEGDVVLDPFMGSGTTAVAAVEAGRHFVGYDTDPDYIATATERIEAAHRAAATVAAGATNVRVGALNAPPSETELDPLTEARVLGLQAKDLVALALSEGGFSDVQMGHKVRNLGFEIPFMATDRQGEPWAFDLVGSFTVNDAGLRRRDALWRTIGRATAFRSLRPHIPFVVFTTAVTSAALQTGSVLSTLTGETQPIRAIIELGDPNLVDLLRALSQRPADTRTG
jgi:site-specific DNA-methyltransferase (adenine-specific)